MIASSVVNCCCVLSFRILRFSVRFFPIESLAYVRNFRMELCRSQSASKLLILSLLSFCKMCSERRVRMCNFGGAVSALLSRTARCRAPFACAQRWPVLAWCVLSFPDCMLRETGKR